MEQGVWRGSQSAGTDGYPDKKRRLAENKFFQKEEFEERYIPVRRELLLKKLAQMQYQDISIMFHPACFEDVDPETADWYCVMARKK